MDRFYELAMESVLIRGIMGLMFAFTVCFMYATGRDVPDSLVGMLGLILGAFFQAGANRRATRARIVKEGMEEING